ncbi:MAG TPA: divergent PAP2 family protein [Acidobacteriota bacterium]|nr:divergent PAP2 family protein [Acidobacteriota bacterium]
MFVEEFLLNKLFLVPLASILLAGFIKSIIMLISDRRLTLQGFLSYGGMPSAHSAAIASITTAIYFEQGFTALFFLALVMSSIVVRDSFGLRMQTGQQAQLINKMNEIFQIDDHKHLKEIMGHTKTQAFFGIILGFVVAWMSYVVF